MAFNITIEKSGRTLTCREDKSVLEAMMMSGRHDIQIGCRGGGCGVCRVQVLAGSFRTELMSSSQVPAEQRVLGYALACKLYPESDLLIRPVGRLVMHQASSD